MLFSSIFVILWTSDMALDASEDHGYNTGKGSPHFSAVVGASPHCSFVKCIIFYVCMFRDRERREIPYSCTHMCGHKHK